MRQENCIIEHWHENDANFRGNGLNMTLAWEKCWMNSMWPCDITGSS
jgi:hypothetical protein